MSDIRDDSGVELDPRDDSPAAPDAAADAKADHDADDIDAVIPGAGDDQGLTDMSIVDADGKDD